MNDDHQLVEFIVKAIADQPDQVKVHRSVDEMGVLLEVYAHEDDLSKIIGRQGKNAKAIRTLAKIIGAKHDARVNVKIMAPERKEQHDDVLPDF